MTACGGGGTPPDTTAPTVTLTAAKTTIESGDTVALTFSAKDDRDPSVTPTLSCNAGTLSGTQLATTRSATATTIACQASARDLAGNTGQATVNITVNPTLGKLALVAGQDSVTAKQSVLLQVPGVALDTAQYSASIEGTPVTLYRTSDGVTLFMQMPDGIAAGARWMDVQIGGSRYSTSLPVVAAPTIVNARTVVVDSLQAAIQDASQQLTTYGASMPAAFRTTVAAAIVDGQALLANVDSLSAAEQRDLALFFLANPRPTVPSPTASAAGVLSKAAGGDFRWVRQELDPAACELRGKTFARAMIATATSIAAAAYLPPPLKIGALLVGGGSLGAALIMVDDIAKFCVQNLSDALEDELTSKLSSTPWDAKSGTPPYVQLAVSPISLGFTNRVDRAFRIKRKYGFVASAVSLMLSQLDRCLALLSPFGLAPAQLQTLSDRMKSGFSEYIPAAGVSVSGISRSDITGAAGGADLRLTLRFVVADPQLESYSFTFTLGIPGGEPIPVNATLTLKLPVVTAGGLTVTQGKSASSNVTFQNATSLEVMTRPVNGSVSLANDGTFSYSPNGQFFGTDSFTYRGRNLDGVSKPETVSISVVRQFEGPWMISVKDSPNAPCFDVKNLETTASISKASDTLYLTSYRGTPIELRMSSANDPAGLSGTATLTYPEDNGTTVQSLSISVPNSTTLSGGGSCTWTRPATDTMPAMNCTGGTAITGTRPAG